VNERTIGGICEGIRLSGPSGGESGGQDVMSKDLVTCSEKTRGEKEAKGRVDSSESQVMGGERHNSEPTLIRR